MLTFIFPGQGSQKKGMGDKLFDKYRELIDSADSILGYSIKKLCMEDHGNKLSFTEFTQPALFIVNSLMYLDKIEETGKKPDYVAGHSLGEYNALFASGVFDFATGVKLVKKRGELMGQAHGGGMAAVIGLSDNEIEKIINENNLSTLSIANYNSKSQTVIAGPKEKIEQSQTIFEKAGAKMYISLKVSGAFHSRYMAPAALDFSKFIDQFNFSASAIPVISNVTARPYKQHDVKKLLVDQITSSIKWSESICYLRGKGDMEFVEIGSGNVLTKLVKQIEKEMDPLVVIEEKEAEGHDKKIDGIERNKSAVQSSQNIEPGKIVDNVMSGKTGFGEITPESLGSSEFKKDYNLKYSYVSGSMYMGISSKEMVVRMGRAGMIGYLGTGGMEIPDVEKSIRSIQMELQNNASYGVNLLYNPINIDKEEKMVDLLLKYGVNNIEASAYMQITTALVRFKVKGLARDKNGVVVSGNKIMAKVSRPEIAEIFLNPAPERIIKKLLDDRKITEEEALLAKEIPVADDLCVEADSGGHTDGGVAYALMPAMIKLRNDMMQKNSYAKKVRIGAAGGIGTPEAAAAAFILGADFILTGSINQCTVEAGTSDAVKNLLVQMNVQDTEYAPAGDMFEFGSKVQVLKKGLFFPTRANKLYNLYLQYNSLDEIDNATRKQLEGKYFKCSFDEIFNKCKTFCSTEEIERAEKNPKQKMALVFRWYFGNTTRLALEGREESRVDYQINCGPALGAFNQWVRGTDLEDWRKRHADEIGILIMNATAELLNRRFLELQK